MFSGSMKYPMLGSTALALAMIHVPVQTDGAESYFSRVHYGGKTYNAGAARVAGLIGPEKGVAFAGNVATTAVFDMSISLEENPQGDNDASADPGASDDAQNAYETMFKHFADAVCEQTNGVHKLGKLTVFRESKQINNVDIQWKKVGHPSAWPSGYGVPGKALYMYDSFGSYKVSDGGTDLISLGYIAGHEWGHYVLGLYDEYKGTATGTQPGWKPLTSDVAVDKSAMHKARNAQSTGDFSWLNHSTSNNIGDVTKTGQGRSYGKSGWDTLIQTTNNDPTTIAAYNFPARVHYSNLVGAQPTASDNWFKLQLPAGRADCRDKLDIQWVDGLELDVVLDRSGSMSGSPITNAKSAATALIDLLTEGETAAGISSFNSSVSSNAPITAIANAADKTTLKNAIASISAGGLTAVFDGAVFGLNKLLAYATANGTQSQQLVFVLSDGGDNSSSETLATTTAKFNAAGVPVIAFGYGGAFDPNMPALAANTGGKFFSSPTTVTDIQNAFSQAFAQASGASALASASVSAAAGETEDQNFVIDDTIDELSLLFTYTGALADIALSLLDDSGADTGQSFACTEDSGAVSCVLNLDAAAVAALGTGTFTVRAVNNSGGEIVHSLNIVATTGVGPDGGSYSVRVGSQNGSTIAYPEPIVISAIVSKALPITGVTVQATVTDPSGNVEVIDLNDDGVGADQYADDGLYSAWAPYGSGGTYDVRVTVTNPDGTAAYSTDALAQAVVDDGDTAVTPTLGGQNFQRFGNLQVTVQGVAADDHSDDPTATGACTTLTTDNVAVAGKFDSPGDKDCFFIPGTISTTDDITVRTFNNALGAEPKFKVFQSDGTTEIADADPATEDPSEGALYKTIAAADIDSTGMVILVEDSDATHTGGSYSVSAGDKLISDVPVAQGGGGGDDNGGGGGGGGATGPVGLLVLALLGLIGIRTRRRRTM